MLSFLLVFVFVFVLVASPKKTILAACTMSNACLKLVESLQCETKAFGESLCKSIRKCEINSDYRGEFAG